jgi:hypothetical protein
LKQFSRQDPVEKTLDVTNSVEKLITEEMKNNEYEDKHGVFLGADPKVLEEFIAKEAEADENLDDEEEEKKGREEPRAKRSEQNSRNSKSRTARDEYKELSE